VIRFSLTSLAALCLAGLAAAQVGLGDVPSAPAWQRWLLGEAVAIGGDHPPACTVVAFYGRPATASAFATDADYLVGLQRRFADAGLAVVAAVGEVQPAGIDRWTGCRVVVDEEVQTADAWLGGDAPGHTVVLDRQGRVVFVGLPAAGLVDAVEHALAAREVLAAEREAAQLRLGLPPTFDDATVEVIPLLEAVVRHARRDGISLGLLYLAQATKANDAAAAGATLRAALAALASEGQPLAAFADLALRGDPGRPGLAAALVAPLRAAAAQAPGDVGVQLALLRALVPLGDGRETGRQAMRMRKLAMTSWPSCLDYAAALTSDRDAAAHRDLATMAIDRAQALGAPSRLLVAARYGVAARSSGDRDEQKRLLEDYVKDTELRASLNNDCWYFLTELPTMGRYDAFAAGLADRMLEQRDGMDYFEFDTAALAMFLAGRCEEAVALQETAIEKGGKGNPEYTERLHRYKAALLPAPR